MKIRYLAAGSVRNVPDYVGRRLVARGIAELVDVGQTYQTRVMVAGAPAPQSTRQTNEDMESLEPEQLREIARERGIKVHPRAGREKILAALRGEG